MRYPATAQQADNIASVSTDMMLGTAIYTLLLGIGFVAFGVRVRKRWIMFWGATMVLAGSAYTIAVIAGIG
jgi:hypothetical protein